MSVNSSRGNYEQIRKTQLKLVSTESLLEPSEGPGEVRVCPEPGPGDKDARWSEFSVSSVAAQVAESEMMQGQWPVSCLCSFVCEPAHNIRDTHIQLDYEAGSECNIYSRLVRTQDIGMH